MSVRYHRADFFDNNKENFQFERWYILIEFKESLDKG
jgi:hypothetical protein